MAVNKLARKHESPRKVPNYILLGTQRHSKC